MPKLPTAPGSPNSGARSLDARSLGEVLGQPQQLQGLLARASRLGDIQRELRAYLQQPWANALRVANLRGTTLVIHADQAAAATAFRHRHDEVLKALSQKLGLPLQRIELKVRPLPRRL
ncbi:MAG TPA: DciA family protein [Nevskiaceae bacterium]|nr:DciA family protein [Nevskiaceae bacterium]